MECKGLCDSSGDTQKGSNPDTSAEGAGIDAASSMDLTLALWDPCLYLGNPRCHATLKIIDDIDLPFSFALSTIFVMSV